MFRIAIFVTVAAIISLAGNTAKAQCSFLKPNNPHFSEIYLNLGADLANGGFDRLSDGRLVVQTTDWSGNWKVNLYSANGALERTLAQWNDAGFFGSFVRVAPDGQTVYFGLTGAAAEGYIRSASIENQTPAWQSVARLDGNYDMEFTQVGGSYVALASALNNSWSGSTGDVNGVWRVDLSGANQHDQVLALNGNSAGLAIGTDGALYGAFRTASGSSAIVAVTAATWQAVLNAQGPDTWLTANENDVLTAVEGGVNDMTVDVAGNLIFDINGGSSQVAAVQAGKQYTGDLRYDVLAIGNGPFGNWLGTLAAEGDVFAGGFAYVSDAFYSTPIGLVPEPATMGLLIAGAAAVLRRRK